MAAPEVLIAGRYRLVRQLGAGGMGVVWEARDERLDRSVAVKQLRTQPGATEDEAKVGAQRALREARINARLHHPYAVSVFDVVEHEGKPCIVMELVPSVPLTEVMRQVGALSPAEAARVGSQVASALAAAHALGIVHRDVKPGNVLIGDDGTARICDFGISRSFGDATLTMTGMITGTPAYLAPEAARGEESTSASDVYSLAATLYAAVEGQPPFGTDGNAIAVLYRVAAGDVRPPVRAGALAPLLLAMLNPDPQARPSMAQAAAHLASLVGGTSAPRSAAQDSPDQTRLLPPPISAPTISLPSGTTVRRPVNPSQPPRPVPTQAPPPQAPAPSNPTPAKTAKRRRPGLIAALVALIVLAGIAAFALVFPNLQRPTTSASPSPTTKSSRAESASPSRSAAESTSAPTTPPATTSPPSTPAPSTPQSSTTPTGGSTAAELAQAVTSYYALLPKNTEAAWQLLTPSYQGQTGSYDSYKDFWNDMDTVTASAVRATAPDSVQATITYVRKSGNEKATERRAFRLVRSDGVLKINESSLV